MVRLIEKFGIEFLPELMILQAFCSWMLLRLGGQKAIRSVSAFFVTALGVGLIVTLISGLDFSDNLPTLGAIYILSQLCISAVRMGIQVIVSKRVSLLQNPQVSTQLSISEESGFLFGAIVLAFLPKESNFLFAVTSLLPFVMALMIFPLILVKKESAAPVIEFENRSRRRLPFFYTLIALFSAVAALKSMAWFGMAMGFAEASRQGGHLLRIFSHVSLIQSGLTLAILVASLKFASKIPNWSLGFRILLCVQALCAAILVFSPMPVLLMGAEVVRKVLERGFLGRSLQLLTSSIPDRERLETRHLMERWSTTSGIAISGVLCYLVIAGKTPAAVLWVMAIVIAGFGLHLRRKLFDSLCDFHVANLTRAHLSGVIQACQVLGNPECRRHHAALTGFLVRHPRPVITKNILLALGRMQHPAVVPYTIEYLSSDREDIQLAAVKSIVAFPGHEINLLLLNSLRDMVRTQVAIRINVIRCITRRLQRLVIPYLLELSESSSDERVRANAVEILGEIAHEHKDKDLRSYLRKFLLPVQPRRVRANAIVALYRDRDSIDLALEAFDRFITSEDPKERDSAAYVAGMLNLRGHENFIWDRSESCHHTNSTLLIALLRLGNPEAPRLLADWIVNAEDVKAREVLVRLSVVPGDRRKGVFHELIEHHADDLNMVLARMRASQREFDVDREQLREEALRRGIQLVEEDPRDEATLKPKAA